MLMLIALGKLGGGECKGVCEGGCAGIERGWRVEHGLEAGEKRRGYG